MQFSPSQCFIESLNRGGEDQVLESLVLGLLECLKGLGLSVQRIQIPLTRVTGFRHPTLFGIILTWSKISGFSDTSYLYHENDFKYEQHIMKVEDAINDPNLGAHLGPFIEVLRSKKLCYRQSLVQSPLSYATLRELQNQGYVDYYAFGMQLPSVPFPQFVSLSSTSPFPKDLFGHLTALTDPFTLALYAAYRTVQAVQIAETYIGPHSGRRVLNGDIARSFHQVVPAGLMFCDIRGFTALSEHLGGEKVVPIMNRLFSAISEVAETKGGEILKFIGDAMLLMFNLEAFSRAEVAQNMVEVVEESLLAIAQIAKTLNLPLMAGFGCHIGEVVYGNIGTSSRLDYTVMGPAVNLTSRIESLTKSVKVPALFSGSIAEHVSKLIPIGEYSMRGLSDPTAVWVLPPMTKRMSGDNSLL